MICSKYEDLTILEKVQMIGKVHHAMQSDNELFDLASRIIDTAEMKGLFENVTILPNNTKDY